ncbi:MAG: hypothetical protein AAGU25_03365 [bacterium]
MEIVTFLAADYANIADHGKLNVMGIFANIYAQIFPAQHPSMFLVIKLRPQLGEYGKERKITILLQDADGKELLSLSNDIKIPEVNQGNIPEVNAILQFNNIVFAKPGVYRFVLLVDKDHKGALDIHVSQSDIQIG